MRRLSRIAGMRLNDHDVTDRFAVRPNGRYEGLLKGLRAGSSVLTAEAPAAPATAS